jgi:diguanylate cyclase (GGDEF)-like protein
MWRTTLGVLVALLLWCASAWAGQPASAAQAEPVAGREADAPIQLSGRNFMPLFGRSSYWLEANGTRSIDQVEADDRLITWRVRERARPERQHGGVFWLRFDASVPVGEHWFVEVASSIHDRIELFYRDRKGQWVRQEAGTSVPTSAWPVPGRVPTFALAADDPAPVRYWLRVEDDRDNFSAPVSLFREDELQDSREDEQFLFGAYSGIAVLVIVAALANGLLFRDRAFIAFSLYSLLFAAGQLGRAGIGAQHIWLTTTVWNGPALALWPGAAAAAGLWFVKLVTEPVRLSRALDLGVWALIAALLGAVAVDVTINTNHSQALVLGLTGLALVALLCMLVWAWLEGNVRPVRVLALGFAPVVLVALFPIARGLGLVGTSVFTRSALFFAAALQLPIIYYALHVRLMTRRESELRASALSRTDPLTGLTHRQGLVERLDSSLARARGQKQNCALLGVRISNLDAIAEEFGRDAAEKALVVAASHLRRTSVDFDLAARVGEREFAVLMEAPVTQPMVTSRAQQVVASGLRQVDALPAALTLKFHVTAAILPVPELDGEGTLQWVMAGLDQMNQDARKLIRPLNFEGTPQRA